MNFNQGFGSNQAFSGGQWPLQQQQPQLQPQLQPQQQQQQQQQHFHMQGQSQQFMQGWQNPGENQQGFPPPAFGLQAPSQHMQFHTTQDMQHSMQPNAANIAAQNQELLKKKQFEEQKRKLKEMSSRGSKSKQEDGRNMLDAMISKADLGLSSSSSSAGFKKTSNNRPTNVFTGHPRPGTNIQHADQEGLSHPQVLPQNPVQIASNFQPQTDMSSLHQNTQHWQQKQQWQQQQQQQQLSLQSQQQHLANFGSIPSVNQAGSPQTEDDFGDFQGGSSENFYEQALGSLNSSTSSLSSLKSSFNSGFLPMVSSVTEEVSPRSVVPGMYNNPPQQPVKNPETSSMPPLTFPYKEASAGQYVDQHYGMNQKILEGFSSSSEMQPPPYSLHSSTSGFQTSDLYPGTSTSVSSHPSISIDAFPMSSVPELIDQPRGSHTASSVLEDQKPVQDQMNMTGNPFSDDNDQSTQIYGCQLPPWFHDSSQLPSVYKKVLEKSLSLDGSIDTAKVTDILLSSNIRKDTLRDIWEMANKRSPGVLVEDELYLILGLVALSQAGWAKLSVSKLSSCNTAPIPEFPEHILMELPTGSVFGGDALNIDNNSRSSSPVDPDDKYSVFRSHSRTVDPVLTPSSIAVSNSQATSFGWSDSITTAQPEEGEVQPQFNDFKKADSSEGWADFQSSVNVTEFGATVNQANRGMDSAKGSFRRESDTSGVLPIQIPSVITGISTVSADMKMQQHTDVSEVGKVGPGEIGFPVGSGMDNFFTSKAFVSSDFDGKKNAEFDSTGHTISNAKSVTTASVGSVDFRGFSLGSTRPDNTAELLEQQQAKGSFKDDEFGDFRSIEFSTMSQDLFSTDHSNQEQRDDAVISPSAFRADFTAIGQAHNNDHSNESWNEFTKSPDESNGASSESGSKQQDILDFSIPFDKNTDLTKEDVNLVLTDLSSKGENPLTDNSMEFPKSSYPAILKPEETFELSDNQSYVSSGIDSGLSSFSFKTPSQDSEIPNTGTAFAMIENTGPGGVSFGGTGQPEFASFAAFGSSTDDGNIFNNSEAMQRKDESEKDAAFLSKETLTSSAANAGVFASVDPSLPNEKPLSSQNRDLKQGDRRSSAEDGFGDFSKSESSKQTEVDNSQFLPSKRVLDMSEQLNAFSWTATTARKDAALATNSHLKDAGSTATVLSQKNSQDNEFVKPTLDVTERYKALTGVLEDSELHVHEWKRCLESVKGVFESATLVMKKHNLTLNNKKEIFESEKGKQYFNGLKEIFAVARRVRTSVENSAIARSNDDLRSLSKDVERYWREICSFSSGLPEYAFPDASKFPALDAEEDSSQCGICLLKLNDRPVEWSNWKMSVASLTYGSKAYHSTCANFWCNKVSPVLPALSPLAAGLL